MKIIYYILIILLSPTLLISCKTTQQQTHEKIVYKDSIVYQLMDTTIYKYIEKEVSNNILKDSDTSYLENTFAYSTAFVNEGFLHHNLTQKEQELAYRVFYLNKYHFISRDSIVMQTKIEYVKRDLSKWQSIQIWLGRFVLGFALVYILYKCKSVKF